MLTLTKDHYIFAMDKNNPPAAEASCGDTVVFETYDCFVNEIQSENQQLDHFNWDRVNPATGPLYIKEAKAGDVLQVKIEKIMLENKGIAMTIKDMGPLGQQIDQTAIKEMQVMSDMAVFKKGNREIEIPLNKMIGVIGTAPAGEPVNCGTPDAHGGNMDCIQITEGATLYLPVNVDGALLALGDLHAAMADGEVGLSGIEIPGSVTLTVTVIKDKPMPTPMLENETHLMTIASHESLNIACDTAVQNMHSYLVNNHDFTKEDAAIFLSLTGQARICQIVDPKKTARMEIKKSLLKSRLINE